MTPTSVGMRCPECAGQTTKVKTIPRRSPTNPYGKGAFSLSDPSTWTVTGVLIAINVAVFLAEVATGVTLGGTDQGWVYVHGALFGPLMSDGYHEYYRILTSGFLHASILHIAMNMLSLWFVGRSLEPAIGKLYFAAIYFTSLLAGSFGALLFEPRQPTLGASGAIFGIFAALIVVAHARRIPIWQTGLVPVLLLNLVFTLTVPGVAIGGHLGGLAAGLFTGWLVVEYGERRSKRSYVLLGCLAVAILSVVGSIAVAGGTGLTPGGFTI
jgi:membrane associated rhomboid family serine protease